MVEDDNQPISAREARELFAPWRGAPAIVVAVSGGPDSTALLWMLARWRRALRTGPRLVTVTVDHGLRPEAAREARDVKRFAKSLDLAHVTKRWVGPKPTTGLPAAARAARYALLGQVARKYGATHIITGHTRDDQAETLLMRLVRGSGVTGLAAMARETSRDGAQLARPLLDVGKTRLVATLRQARVDFVQDPTNIDPHYTRPRVRAILAALASEGLDAARLARLAMRLQRADAALDAMAHGADRFMSLTGQGVDGGFDAIAFTRLPEEIQVRLLGRAIGRVGHEGSADLGQVEALVRVIIAASVKTNRGIRLRQTLAGALVTLTRNRLLISPAPHRRDKRAGGMPTNS